MNGNETTKTLYFFSNIIKRVSTQIFNQSDRVPDKVTNPIVKFAFLKKCCKHTRILKTKEKYQNNSELSFFCVTLKKIHKEIRKFYTSRASQDNNIQTKIITEIWNFFIFYFSSN